VRRPTRPAAAILTAALLFAACSGEDDTAQDDVTTPTASPTATLPAYDGPPPGPQDHWHVPYLFELCGQQIPAIQNDADPSGIHTHADGVIHIHPFTIEASGEGATLGAFLGAMGLSLTDDTLSNESRDFTLSESVGCPDGSKGEFRVARWSLAEIDQDPEIITDGLADIAFTEDLMVITIAFGPEDRPISRPPSIANLRSLVDVDVQPELPAAVDAYFGGALTEETPCPAADGSEAKIVTFVAPPPDCLTPGSTYVAVFDTSAGEVRIQLDVTTTPQTANNFIVLARYHYYDNTRLFRTEPSIGIIQGGAPKSNAANDPGPGYTITDEGAEYTYEPGDLVMARTSEPNSASAQFFFAVNEESTNLDFTDDEERLAANPGLGTYVRFGTILEGLDVLEAILATHDPVTGGPLEPVILNSVTIEETPGEAPALTGEPSEEPAATEQPSATATPAG
jgi:cyclophilin family peptidyl-prolyl cis-trans isomerase